MVQKTYVKDDFSFPGARANLLQKRTIKDKLTERLSGSNSAADLIGLKNYKIPAFDPAIKYL